MKVRLSNPEEVLTLNSKELLEYRMLLESKVKSKAVHIAMETKREAMLLQKHKSQLLAECERLSDVIENMSEEILNLKSQLKVSNDTQRKISSRLHHYRAKLIEEIDDSVGIASLLDKAYESRTDCEGPRQ